MIGNLGISKFGDYRKFVMGFTTLLAILIILLFIAGMAGWATEYSTLKNSAWGTSDGKAYYGLQGVATSSTFVNYKDCSEISLCKECKKAGSAALGLLLVSFFMQIAVIIGSVVRMFKDSEVMKILMVVLSFLIWIFSVAAFGNWNEVCYNAIHDAGASNLKYGGGYGCAVAGWFFMSFIFLFHLLTPVDSGISSGGGGGNDMSKA